MSAPCRPPRRIAATAGALLLAGAAPAQPVPRAAGRLPAGPMTMRMAPARDEDAAALPADAFLLGDAVNVPVAFLLVPGHDSRATAADRHLLASGQSGTFGCGRPACVVRFMAGGAVVERAVLGGQLYRFLILNGRFDLYRIGAPR